MSLDQQDMDLYGTFQKNLAKSSAEHAWQTIINKDSTMIRNQKPSSNDRDRNVYLAFLLIYLHNIFVLLILIIFSFYNRSSLTVI